MRPRVYAPGVLRSAIVAVSVLAGALAGCNEAGNPDNAEELPFNEVTTEDLAGGVTPEVLEPSPSSTVVATPSLRASVTRLEDLALFDSPDSRALFVARESKMSACMLTVGFAYVSGPFVDRPSRSSRALYPSLDLVATYGYAWRPYALDLSLIPIDPNLPYPTGYEDAYNNCGTAINGELRLEELSELTVFLAKEQSAIESTVKTAPAILAGVENWSACMTAEGYVFQTPDDAERSVDNAEVGPLSARGIQQALKDYACRREARLEEIAQEVRAGLVDTWVELHPTFFGELAEAKVAVLNALQAG